jgi:hypothetical protein
MSSEITKIQGKVSILDYFRNAVNFVFLVRLFNANNLVLNKLFIIFYFIFLIIMVKILVNLVVKGDNTLLKSSIVTYIQILIFIIVILCDTKSNGMNKTVFRE